MTLQAQADQDLAFPIVRNSPNAQADQDFTFIVAQRLVPAIVFTSVDQDLKFAVVQRIAGLRQIIGTFLDPGGNPIANGVLKMKLNADGTYLPLKRSVAAGRTATIPLDSDGNIVANTYVWPNGSLQPAGSVYRCQVFTALGLMCWSQDVSIPAGVGAYSFNG
jgi:hypothetical protein